MKNKVLVFDCDGTVLDTFELIEHIVFSTFEELFPDYPLTVEEAHSFFGPYITDTFQKYVTEKVSLDDCVNVYAKYADLYTPKYIKTYDGMIETLKELKKLGYIITVASNKISFEVDRGLKLCNMRELVDYIVGAEMMEHAKPNPDCIYQIMSKYDVKSTIMIGDTPSDILTGKNAGVYTIGVTWCQNKDDVFIKSEADEIVHHPIELIDRIRKYEDKL